MVSTMAPDCDVLAAILSIEAKKKPHWPLGDVVVISKFWSAEHMLQIKFMCTSC